MIELDQEIAISVTNKIAETDFSEVVSFNSVYRLKFTLDGEWDEFPSRVAVVMWAGGAAEKLFTGTECEMPQISAMGADTVLIGVYSRRGDKRIASSFVRIRCEAGAGGFPQPKPTLSLHEQVLSFLNQKDWDLFEDKVAEGIYSAVRVNRKGLVTEGMKIIEVGKEAGKTPSPDLAPGGIFFRMENGIYTPCYYDGSSLQPLTLTASDLGHTLTIGDQSFDGTADVTVKLGKLAAKDKVVNGDIGVAAVGSEELGANVVAQGHLAALAVSSAKLAQGAVITEKIADKAVTGAKLADDAVKAGEHISVTRDGMNNVLVSAENAVFSVNGMTGDVTLDQDTLGLANVAYSGNYRDLVGAPDTGVYSVNGMTGKVVIDHETLGLADIAMSGSYLDLVDAPESGVLSVNGMTGNVSLTGDSLGLAAVATSGSYNDLKDKPAAGGVTSVNGMTGEVTLDASGLGLGALAMKDQVETDDIAVAAVGASQIAAASIIGAHIVQKSISGTRLADKAVSTDKLADGAVTGAKLAEDAIKAGMNISVTRDETNSFVVSTALTTGVTSVNGKTGDVTVDKESLGIGDPLSLSGEAENGADFNNLRSGVYSVIGTSSKPCSHMPASLDNVDGNDCYWILFAIPTGDGSRCVQIAFSGKSDGATRIRTFSGGAWSTWKSIYA